MSDTPPIPFAPMPATDSASEAVPAAASTGPGHAPMPGPIHLIHLDDHIVVLAKPACLGVTPERTAANSPATPPDTLTNRLWHHLLTAAATATPINAAAVRPFIVHRLDRDVSGVIVFARTAAAHRNLSLQFEHHTVAKTYLGVVAGIPTPAAGTIDLPIGPLPKPNHRTRGRIFPNAPGAKPARTAYQTRKVFPPATAVQIGALSDTSPAAVIAAYAAVANRPGAALLELTPTTGRRHQLRVHLAAQGHPLIGDPLYARKNPAAAWPESLTAAGHPPRVALHATTLAFRHPAAPADAAPVEFTAPLPADLTLLVNQLSTSATAPAISGE